MRRRLFWKIYLTLLASLVVAAVVMSAFFWFLNEAQRESFPQQAPAAAKPWPHVASLYGADGKLIAARGPTILPSEHVPGRRWGPGRVLRIDLPDGQFMLTRFGPPPNARAIHILLVMLVVAGSVGVAAYPVTALLTRRLEALRSGVARWGEHAAPVDLDACGSDEVALLARTFNAAATRIDALLASQKALLANASHELRSPLARLRVAIEMGPDDRPGASRTEIIANLEEMDQLVGELLLTSRLDYAALQADRRESVDLLGLAAEEAARVGAQLEGDPVEIYGDPVLLRRLIRNLVENGIRHGLAPVDVTVRAVADGAEIVVSDAGPGLPAAEHERIFEPFYRPAGSREAAGGWGLGLALVRQIARHHGGSARCESAPAGGSRFVVVLGSLPRNPAIIAE